MTDDIRSQLEHEVEQIITPLRASPRRKSLMREELLAHLISLYEHESTQSPSTPAALTATLRRFGNADSLTLDLQSSVPALERIFSWNKELAMKRLWLNLLLLGIAGLAFGLSLVLPALAKLKLDGHLPGPPIAFLVLGAVSMFAGAQAFAWGIARRMRRTT